MHTPDMSIRSCVMCTIGNLVSLFNAKFSLLRPNSRCYSRSYVTRFTRSPGHIRKESPRQSLRLLLSVEEEVLINVCPHGMLEEYRIFLENLFFAPFSKLMEAACRTNESVSRILKPSLAVQPTPSPSFRPDPRKRSIVVAWPLRRVRDLDQLARRSHPTTEESLGCFPFCHLFLVTYRKP